MNMSLRATCPAMQTIRAQESWLEQSVIRSGVKTPFGDESVHSPPLQDYAVACFVSPAQENSRLL